MSTTDTDFTLNKQGGAKTVDVGRSTDLATGVNFNDHAGIHVAWKDATAHTPVNIAFGFELLKRSFSTRILRHTAEDSTRNTTVPRYRSNSVIWRTAGRDRVGLE